MQAHEELNGGETVSLNWHVIPGLIPLSLKIFVLRILTLGIYYFWGKTEVRRRIWSATHLQHQPLEYTGTGKELFLGFLLVFLLFIIPAYGVVIAVQLYFGQDSVFSVTINIAFFTIIFFLIGVARYRARRYRLTRTRWRGIRAGMTGSPWTYGLYSFALSLLIPVTLGFILPLRDVILQRRLVSETRFGTMPFRFSASARELYGPFVVMWFGTILIYGMTLFILWLLYGSQLIELVQANIPPPPAMLFAILFSLFAAFVLYLLMSAWYNSRKFNLFARSTNIDAARLNLETTGLGLAGLQISNLLIVLLTLGIATPIVQARIARYFITRMSVVGAIDLDRIRQDYSATEKTGEGLAEAFDIDAF
ncbi:MAG: DUF898 family protein [Methyloligellaceae bacterium]